MGKAINTGYDFYTLTAWQQAHKLALCVYKLTKSYPDDERYGLISQLRRAASSVTANLAEGYDRYYHKEKARFYLLARGSAAEVHNFLILSKDLMYIDEETFEQLSPLVVSVRQLLSGLIRAQRADYVREGNGVREA